MSVYVDDLIVYGGPGGYRGKDAAQAARVGDRNGHAWCHLWADSVPELLEFAKRIGMREAWLQRSRRGFVHFDLTPGRREAAIRTGALALERHAACESRRRIFG